MQKRVNQEMACELGSSKGPLVASGGSFKMRLAAVVVGFCPATFSCMGAGAGQVENGTNQG